MEAGTIRRHSENTRTNADQAASKSWDERALAGWRLPASLPLRYDLGIQRSGLEAADADPNVTPPDESLVIVGGGQYPVSAVGVFPAWSATAQQVVVDVYVRSGLSADDGFPEWIPVKRITFVGDGTDVEQVVESGFRDVFVRVVSGADETHPLTLLEAVA